MFLLWVTIEIVINAASPVHVSRRPPKVMELGDEGKGKINVEYALPRPVKSAKESSKKEKIPSDAKQQNYLPRGVTTEEIKRKTKIENTGSRSILQFLCGDTNCLVRNLTVR